LRSPMWLSVFIGVGFSCLIGGLITGCAGPVTPLGAISALRPSQAFESKEGLSERELETLSEAARVKGVPSYSSDSSVSIAVTPSHQKLHGPSIVQLTIRDSSSDFSDLDLWIRYNGLDVTDSFLQGARIVKSADQHWVKIENSKIRLDSRSDNSIEFFYRNLEGSAAYFRYDPPRCNAFQSRKVVNTEPFHVTHALLEMIERNAGESGLSPAFLSALIAQESSFNSRRVSSKRALGLTQMTSVAETEVISGYEDWPRYPGINDLSLPILKMLVLAGRINRTNEWRLDPGRSIQGGVAYARILAKRWSSPEVMEWLQRIGLKGDVQSEDAELERTRLILASYNSGAARVQSAVTRYGKNWLTSPHLREARRYVNQIMSYCYFFTEEVTDA